MPDLPISTALSEAKPDSLQDLFARDPTLLTDADLDRIISEIREQRDRIEATPGGKVRQARVTVAKQLNPNADLSDLGL